MEPDDTTTEIEHLRLELAAEVERREQAEEQLAGLEVELTSLRAHRADALIAQLHADGRLPIRRDASGEVAPSRLKVMLHGLATRDFEAAVEYAASMPSTAPVGPRALETALGFNQGGEQGGTHEHSGGGQVDARLSISPHNAIQQYAIGNNISAGALATAMAQCGVTPEMLAEYGPRRPGRV